MSESAGANAGDGDDSDRWKKAVRNGGIAFAVLAYPGAFLLDAFELSSSARIGAGVGAFLIAVVTAVLAVTLGSSEIRRELRTSRRSTKDMDEAIDKLDHKIGQISKVIATLIAAVEVPALQTVTQIKNYETGVVTDAIWVSSRDLALDLSSVDPSPDVPKVDFMSIMRSNLKGGINYTYLLKDNSELREKAAKLMSHLSPRPVGGGRLTFYFLTEGEFSLLPYTEGNFAIYNPLLTEPGGARVSAEFPSGNKQLWMIVVGPPAHGWIDRVKPLMDRVPKRHGAVIRQE